MRKKITSRNKVKVYPQKNFGYDSYDFSFSDLDFSIGDWRNALKQFNRKRIRVTLIFEDSDKEAKG